MARPTKVGLDYFPLDCHMEEKIRLIQAEFGLKGFAVVVKLYQKIYGERGYYCEWNEDSLLLFMSENGVSSRDEKNLIEEIVRACIRRHIFSETLFHKYGVLTSAGVQRRYLESVSRRENVELKKEYLLISVPKNAVNVVINSINVCNNSNNVCSNTQSKVKENKVNKSKVKESIEPVGTKQKPTRHKYGEYNHVLLTDEQYSKLIGDYSEAVVKEYIKKVDEYCQQYGRSYNDYNLTIRNWLRKDGKNAEDKRSDSDTSERYGNYI